MNKLSLLTKDPRTVLEQVGIVPCPNGNNELFGELKKLVDELKEMYDHGPNKKQKAGVILLIDKVNVVMIQNHISGLIGHPKGAIEANETPKQAAVRELKEETALVVSEDQLVEKEIIAGSHIYYPYNITYEALNDIKLNVVECNAFIKYEINKLMKVVCATDHLCEKCQKDGKKIHKFSISPETLESLKEIYFRIYGHYQTNGHHYSS
jgi:8-oxo-dGTP pyrophosphatase MutT (NUDIX family)